MRSLILCCLAAWLAAGSAPVVASETTEWQGKPLPEYLDSLSAGGLRILYSSDLVKASQVVLEEPDANDPRASLGRLLRPYGLKVIDGPAGSLLVARAAVDGPAADRPEKDPQPLPEVIVTASLHRMQNLESGSHTYLDRELATRIPAAAEEAARVTSRMPGTASGGVSSRNHIRGGEANEVLFLFDGLRLYEPYHLRDFQAVASIVNVAAIGGIDFYTGAYPVRYGDRMSGVMNMQMREPGDETETELGLSFFNASALSMGRFGDGGPGDWLVAARRGNLDLIVDVIDPDYGSPDYHDLLAHVGYDFGPRVRLSANVLLSRDKIDLADDDVGEAASARYDNRVAWLKWLADWSDGLRSETIVSISDISDRRSAALELPGIVSGVLDEVRDFQAIELQQDWIWSASPRWMLSAGFRLRHQDARYRFDSARSVEVPFDQLFDNELLTVRAFDLSPEGGQYAAYSELRWQAMDRLVVDLGMRWDQQTYTTSDDDRQYSPRISVLLRGGRRTTVRFGFGQFYQAQEINELQVSDGVDVFFPAQRARHVVAKLEHSFDSGVDLDLSLYRKAFRSLRPRFENAFDALTLAPELQFDRIRIAPDRSESRGVELTLSSGDAEDALFWWLSYAWSEVEDTIDDTKVKRSWDQVHTGKLGISWRWGAWDLSAAGEIHTGWPRTLISMPVNSSRYAPFHTLDVRVSRDFDLRYGALTAFLEVTNVYNRRNPCCTEYSTTTGSGDVAELTARETHWLPIVPSLGFVWRF